MTIYIEKINWEIEIKQEILEKRKLLINALLTDQLDTLDNLFDPIIVSQISNQFTDKGMTITNIEDELKKNPIALDIYIDRIMKPYTYNIVWIHKQIVAIRKFASKFGVYVEPINDINQKIHFIVDGFTVQQPYNFHITSKIINGYGIGKVLYYDYKRPHLLFDELDPICNYMSQILDKNNQYFFIILDVQSKFHKNQVLILQQKWAQYTNIIIKDHVEFQKWLHSIHYTYQQQKQQPKIIENKPKIQQQYKTQIQPTIDKKQLQFEKPLIQRRQYQPKRVHFQQPQRRSPPPLIEKRQYQPKRVHFQEPQQILPESPPSPSQDFQQPLIDEQRQSREFSQDFQKRPQRKSPEFSQDFQQPSIDETKQDYDELTMNSLYDNNTKKIQEIQQEITELLKK